ncbi:MAG: hypothetical protein JWM28_2696 [Chitinophagaceae bacterium]|nr:hypothetical protein [Chitinophagaceae bacterium]
MTAFYYSIHIIFIYINNIRQSIWSMAAVTNRIITFTPKAGNILTVIIILFSPFIYIIYTVFFTYFYD